MASRSTTPKKSPSRRSDLPARKPIPVSNRKLIALAKKNPPPQSWFEETDLPFVPVRRKPRNARAA